MGLAGRREEDNGAIGDGWGEAEGLGYWGREGLEWKGGRGGGERTVKLVGVWG